MDIFKRYIMPILGFIAVFTGFSTWSQSVFANFQYSANPNVDPFDWAISITRRIPVADLIAERSGATMELLIGALLVALILAPLVPYAGRIKVAEKRFLAFGSVVQSVPIFWLGLILIAAAVSYEFVGIPLGGRCDVRAVSRAGCSSLALWERFDYYITPMLLLVMPLLGRVWLAVHPKHDGERYKHILVAGLNISSLVTTLILIETIFSYPGLGNLFVNALAQRDYPVIWGVAGVLVLYTGLISLVFQLIYNVMTRHEDDVVKEKRELAEKAKTGTEAIVDVIKQPVVMTAIVVLLLCLLLPVLNTILGKDPNAENLVNRFQAPQHLLDWGADDKGRDFQARVFLGAFTSVSFAIQAALLATVIGAAVGWLASKLSVFVPLVRTFAYMLPAVLVLVMLRQGIEMTTIQLAMATGVLLAPLVATWWLRNPPNRVTVYTAMLGLFLLATAEALMIEMAISFLGFGIYPPTPSLGNLLANAQAMIRNATFLVWVPGLFVFFIAFSLYNAAQPLLPHPFIDAEDEPLPEAESEPA